jgi:hypothetical protein
MYIVNNENLMIIYVINIYYNFNLINIINKKMKQFCLIPFIYNYYLP